MAITSSPLTASLAANPSPGVANPLTLQAVGQPNVNLSSLNIDSPSSAINTLAQGSPQSLTSLLLPLYSQLFNANTGALAQNEGLQASQGVAQAQSGAQQRGLTGSSIEAGAMQGAEANAQNAYTQGYASLLGNYVNSYAGLASQDVSNQQSYYSNLAQALGQGYASQVQMNEFNQQLSANQAMASQANNAALWSAGISAAGNLGSAAIKASDIRLKKNVKKIGVEHGFNVYSYEYDRDKASRDCPELLSRLPPGKFVGFMAHHVAEKYPKAVKMLGKYLAIDYKILNESIHA